MSLTASPTAPTDDLRTGGNDAPNGSSFLLSLYRQHFQMVWHALLRLGVPRDAVEDAVQDVFLVVHRRQADFAGRSSAKTWIYGIAIKVAKEHRRKDARHQRRLLGMKGHVSAIGEAPVSPDQEVEQREAARITEQVLDRMKAQERELLVLVELEELSVAEAAAALELHVRTCQRRLRSARTHFECLLEAAMAHSRIPAPNAKQVDVR